METFEKAFSALLSLAPGPVFPRARQLYLNKYPLEGNPSSLDAAALPARFRTFLLEEEIHDGSDGIYRVEAKKFAVVHWQAPQTDSSDYLSYLERRWQLVPDDLAPVDELWFREGGAYATFTASAVYQRQGGGELRVSLGNS